MKMKDILWGMALAACVLACSSDKTDMDGRFAAEDDLSALSYMSDVPIVFAPVNISDVYWTGNTVETRGGSVNSTDFTTDSLGIFCLAKKPLQDAPKTLTWSRPYNELYNKHLVWTENEMASIKSIGGNQGVITWSGQQSLQCYPSNAWYTYGFVAYHPWTKHVVFTKSTLTAYIKVDGNDDVIHALANSPETVFDDDEVDGLAFSSQYYDKIRANGLSLEGTYTKFQFNHLMSRLDFYFCFNTEPTRNIHVDKVEFDDFPCIVKVPLAQGDFTNGQLKSSVSTATLYVLNDNSNQLGSIKTYDGSLLKDDPQFASSSGHFELREKGETPISGIREGDAYKYNLTTEPQKVGDCILIPPVKKSHSKSTIKLFVTLADDSGNKYHNTSAIRIPVPSTDDNWMIGSRYDIRITLNAPSVAAAPRRAASTFTASKVEVIPQ